MYNLLYVKPVPLVERYLRREAPGRIDARGAVIEALDENAVRTQGSLLAREHVESIAVCLINAHVNGSHERRIRAILAEVAPGIPVSLSSEILPEIREYERTSTTVIDAYVRPIVVRYLRSLLERLREYEVAGPLFLMQSSGGFTSAEGAITRPVTIVESGPAAGVVGACLVAAAAGIPSAIAFDMGGTTAKAALLEHGQFHITTDFEIGGTVSIGGLGSGGGGYPIRVPAIDLAEVGAGGGSIVALDPGNSLHVGPRSAGSRPGPICYQRGGQEITVTDANLVLGYLNPTRLAGGSISIDAERARAAIDERLAAPLGLGILEAAWAVHMLANASMIEAIKAVSLQRGRDPRQCALIAFGGSGPLHAASMAMLLEIQSVLVPPAPGVFSAFGLLVAEYKYDLVRSFYRTLAEIDLRELDEMLGEMEAAALAETSREGYTVDQIVFLRTADLRYVGQGFELTVPMNLGRPDVALLTALEEAFNDEHLRTYGHGSRDAPVQLVALRLTARHVSRPPAPPQPHVWPRSDDVIQHQTRLAYFGEAGRHETRVVDRQAVGADPLTGPLIIEEYDTSTVVPPGSRAWHDPHGNLIIKVGAG
jgi:N-methylhydantoinase A